MRTACMAYKFPTCFILIIHFWCCCRCLPIPEVWGEHHGFQLTCPEGYYNDLATGFLSNDVFVIRTLLNLGSETMPITQVGAWLQKELSWLSVAFLQPTLQLACLMSLGLTCSVKRRSCALLAVPACCLFNICTNLRGTLKH
jgi:hypothetical protein